MVALAKKEDENQYPSDAPGYLRLYGLGVWVWGVGQKDQKVNKVTSRKIKRRNNGRQRDIAEGEVMKQLGKVLVDRAT